MLEFTGIKVTEALQVAISLVGFLLVWHQIRQLQLAVHGDTQSKLYDHYLKVSELMLQKPHLRPYFYRTEEGTEGTELSPSAKMRLEIETMAEIIAGLLEHAALQRPNLPDDSWRNCWEAFMRGRFEESPDLKRFFVANHGWYAQAFREMLERAGIVPRNAA
jgi:hypothetical protein